MKNIARNFFSGATSLTIYPCEAQIPHSSMQEAWKRVWNSFAIANANLNEVIYGQTRPKK